MARVKRGVQAKARHKKVLKQARVSEVQEVGLTRSQNKPLCELDSMLTEIEELRRESSVLCGLSG